MDSSRTQAKKIIRCANCSTANRVPVVTTGTPVCGSCERSLPWLVNVTDEHFSDVISTSTVPVLVDLWAPWCGPCHAVAPILEQLAIDRAGSLRVVKVNVDEAPTIQAAMSVRGIPTMVLFDNGNEVGRQVGAAPASSIEHWLDTTLG